jgi:hypothetical protein
MHDYDTDHQTWAPAVEEPRRRMSPLVQLTIRRSLALAIALGMAYGIFHDSAPMFLRRCSLTPNSSKTGSHG